MTTATMATGTTTARTARAESELRAAARRHGITMKELAAMMGVGAGYLSQFANGRRPWTPKMREKVAAVLGEVPGQGIVYRQGGAVTGESSFIRERARVMGMSMRDLADRVGVSYSYLSQVSRGHSNMGVKVQARVESALNAPAKVAPAQCANRQGDVVVGESSFIRERAREMGMTMRDLADRAGVSYGYMTHVARGHGNMGVKVQTRIESALKAPARVAPAQCANRPASVVSGQSSYVRERARALGMTMRELAERVGVSASYMSEVSRGRRGMGVRVQALVEAALEAEATVASAQLACVDPKAVWDRMDAHGISQNEVARRAGISSSYLSQIMNGRSSPSAGVLKRLHGVLFQPHEGGAGHARRGEGAGLAEGRAQRDGGARRRWAGAPRQVGGPAVRVGGRVPWGAKAEYAYRAGYDGAGRVSMTPVLMPGYSAMLKQPEPAAA